MGVDKKKIARRYDRWSGFYDIFDLGGKTLPKREAVERLSAEPGHFVIDVGTGTGAILDLVGERVSPGGMVLAVDISEKMVEKVNRRFRGREEIRGVVADVENLPFEDGSFDRALATFAFTSFPDPWKAMREIYRVLKKGGKMVVVDTGGHIKENLGGLGYLRWRVLKGVMYAIGYTRIDVDVVDMARRAGFSIVELKHYRGSMVYLGVFVKE